MKKKTSRKPTKPEPSPDPGSPSRARRGQSAAQKDAARDGVVDPYYTESEALALARQKVINATPAITEAIIEQAKTGSYTHARMLFDFIGLIASPPATPEAEPLNPFIESLAQALGLKLPDVPGVVATPAVGGNAA